MSFIPAVRREIQQRNANDPVRITLEYLINNGIGQNNPVPLSVIVGHLQSMGISMNETLFQQTILKDSRGSDYFIGSGNRGYFLIETIGDAQKMRDFYQNRIAAEENNLDNLRRLSVAVGWSI